MERVDYLRIDYLRTDLYAFSIKKHRCFNDTSVFVQEKSDFPKKNIGYSLPKDRFLGLKYEIRRLLMSCFYLLWEQVRNNLNILKMIIFKQKKTKQ